MILVSFPVGPLQCNCVVLGDEATGEALVVDPGGEAERVLEALRGHGLRCRTIVNTHTHIDHVGANEALKAATGASLLLHESDEPLYDRLAVQAAWLGDLLPAPARAVVDDHVGHGDHVRAGSLDLEVLHTPGHTPGSICLHLPGPSPLLLAGDTLFAGGVGRTDLWGGDMEQEMESIRTRILALEDRTRVIPGHGPETTVGRERRHNPFLAGLRGGRA